MRKSIQGFIPKWNLIIKTAFEKSKQNKSKQSKHGIYRNFNKLYELSTESVIKSDHSTIKTGIFRVVIKYQLPEKFTNWVQGDHQLDFGWRLFHMKRGTNDSKVNHLLSFDTKHIVELQENIFQLSQVLIALWGVNQLKQNIVLSSCFPFSHSVSPFAVMLFSRG